MVFCNKNVIKIYYAKDNFGYKVEYYYDGLLDDSKTDAKSATYQSVISNYTDKAITGYKLEKTENLPLTIASDETNNLIKVYYVKDTYSYKVEHYKENIDGNFEIVSEDTTVYENVLFNSVATYKVNQYEDYTYNEDISLNLNSKVPANDDLVIRLYYNLNESDAIIHYVIKVGDNYISLNKYGRDELGNITPDFKNVELEDDVLKGKIGSKFTTTYRLIPEYTFIGLYNGNILENEDITKIEGTTINSTFEKKTKEYTYIYEAPLGDSEELPPQTGVETDINYLNYLLLVLAIYIIRKYFI